MSRTAVRFAPLSFVRVCSARMPLVALCTALLLFSALLAIRQVAAQGNSLPSSWVSQDVGDVGVAGSASYANDTFTVRGSGADIWEYADAFHDVYQPLAGDMQIVARVTNVGNTDPYAKAGVMIRETLAANSLHTLMVVTASQGASFQRRTMPGGVSYDTTQAGVSAPQWVKLVRQGNTFSGYASSDGASWTLVGTETIPMATNVHIGLAVTSHNNAALCTSAFDFVSVTGGGSPPPSALPSPWASGDIGSVGVAGSATHASGSFTVKGSGTDIWDYSDSFRYVHQPLTGDGQIVARVASVQNTDSWAKAGVMIREMLSPDSKHAMVIVTPTNGVSFQRRIGTGGVSTFTAGGTEAAPFWVKLVRSDNTFSASRSADGVTWTPTGTETIPMAANVYVGLAVTSHNNAILNTSIFDNVAVSGAP